MIFLFFLADVLYGCWEPIIDTLINEFLMFVNALEELVNLFEDIMMEILPLMDAAEKLLEMLESMRKEFDGLLKLLGILLNAVQQLLNLIEYRNGVNFSSRFLDFKKRTIVLFRYKQNTNIPYV